MYDEQRAMFRASPVRFLVFVALIAAAGLGLLLLFTWWLRCRFQRLRLSDGLIVFESGVLSKEHVELQASMVRAIRVDQGLLQRILDVGDIYVTSSGSSPEIRALDMPAPKRFRDLVNTLNRAVPAI